jgi:glutamyl-tRNA reductase
VEISLARRSATKPLLIVDLGVPRNVDPSVGRLPGIHLIDLDGIPGAVETDRNAVLDAEQIVERELNRLLKWIRHREAAPLVARLARRGTGGLKGPALHRAILQLKEEAAA